MRKMFLLIAVMLLAVGQADAQRCPRLGQGEWQHRRAEYMTERMASEYGLNDKQKEALLKVNEQWLYNSENSDSRYYGRRSQNGWNGCHQRRGCRPDYTPDYCPNAGDCRQNCETAGDRRAAAHCEYNNRLKEIMTKEQYENYLKR